MNDTPKNQACVDFLAGGIHPRPQRSAASGSDAAQYFQACVDFLAGGIHPRPQRRDPHYHLSLFE